jgi:crotonobetainyl-CoA:carnitine CoA-transferase CaiB-like acyl-CoA transferase
VADATRRAYGEPALVPSVFADKVAGLTIVYAVLAALVHRERTGKGQRLEVPMTEAVKAFMLVEHGAGAIPQPPMEPAGYARVLTPQRRPQATADGWINVLPYSKEQYDSIFAAGGRDDLLGDERYSTGRLRIANSDFPYEQVRGIIASRTTSEWLEFCKVNHIPASRVVTLDEIVDEQPVAEHPIGGPYKQVRPAVRMSATPIEVRRHAPLPGEHNAEVLAMLGYSDDEVDELAESGVLRSRVSDSGRGRPAPRR